MILRSKYLFPWLLFGSFIIFFIFSQSSSSFPFRRKELKQRFNGGWEPGCDLSNGSWVRDTESSHGYTNQTCKMIPESKNCGKYGKKGDYERWRWQPARCKLPRFDAAEFLEISRGKRMAFVGDSVARNQADSLACFLSQVRPYHNFFFHSDLNRRTLGARDPADRKNLASNPLLLRDPPIGSHQRALS